MAKYNDTSGCGKSDVVPYRPAETWHERHTRRLASAMLRAAEVHNWCDLHGIRLNVSNGGHHWRFALGPKVAEWWPASAKLVFQRGYHQGTHCHDAVQLLESLRRRWKLRKLPWLEQKP
ncbi:MAG: hypothetical protein V2A79_09955 [Planctomycetota bacterium]